MACYKAVLAFTTKAALDFIYFLKYILFLKCNYINVLPLLY